MNLPRYFVPRAAQEPRDSPLDPAGAVHVVDCFSIARKGKPEDEWLVTTDALGNLLAVPAAERAALPGPVQAELAAHEVCGARCPRRIAAAELFLFNLQLLEQPVQAPGLDDPVYLYGTLFGPYPPAGAAPAAVEGQLTVTRADLLDGLAQAAACAFRYPAAGGEAGQVGRCCHLLLPGDREEAIRAGRGLVLAYPLLPPDLLLYDQGNEVVVGQLLHDVLRALREDLEREQVQHPLRSRTLPVPNRTAVEQELVAQGYEIRGETAVRRVRGGEGFRGFLVSVYGSLAAKELELPPEGTVNDLLQLARETLAALPGFPPSRVLALRARVNDAPLAGQPVPARHAPPAATPPVPRPAPRVVLSRAADPAEWMRDFMGAHQAPGAPKPRLTSTTEFKPPLKRKRGEPDWMDDFRQPSSEADPPAAPCEEKPAWTKDFE